MYSNWALPSRLSDQNFVRISHRTNARYMSPPPLSLSRSDHLV